MDVNVRLLEALENRLEKAGCRVTFDKTHARLIINDALKIGGMVIEHPGASPKIIQLQISAFQDDLVPGGIIENLVGFGDTIDEKIESGLDNYFSTTWPSIIGGLFGPQGGEFDYRDRAGVLWHAHVGNMSLQGRWETNIFDDPIFYLLKPLLIQLDLGGEVIWVKVYVSKQPDGRVVDECLLNNEPWEAGYNAVAEYAGQWNADGRFLGQKQFMMLRRCQANCHSDGHSPLPADK